MSRIKIPFNQLITIPYSVYELLVNERDNNDAFTLYYRYLVQVQIQGTNVTKSNDVFMQAATGFGRQRFQKAKKVLTEEGLVKSVPIQNAEGVVEEWKLEVYSLVNTAETVEGTLDVPVTRSMIIHPVVKSPSGVGETQLQSGELAKVSHAIQKYQNPPGGKTTTKNILTNSNNNTNTIKIKEDKKEIVSEVSPSIDGETNTTKTISSIILTEVYSRIKKANLAYSSSPEDTKYAFILSKTKVFLTACEQVGGAEVLVKTIMEYVYTDKFWMGKVISIADFYRHWQKLYSHLAVNKKFSPVVSKANIAVATDFFDSF